MCQKDFDFASSGGRSVGKMESRRESCNGSSRDDDHHHRQYQQTHPSSKRRSSRGNSNDNMISPSLEEKNSLEDGSQGREISGLDHQLPSMGKLEISGVGESTRSNRNGEGDTTSSSAGCLSCSRQRRPDDYGGNDFGECHQHQLLSMKQQQQEKKIGRKVNRAFSTFLKRNPSQGAEADDKDDEYRTYSVSKIGTESAAVVSSSSKLLQHPATSSSPESIDESPRSPKQFQEILPETDVRRGCRQTYELLGGFSRAMWIQLGMLILLSFSLQGASAVRINSLSVPHVIKNGTEESVILDCDYSIEDHEKKGLVVKWYFSNKQTQVYQWIPNREPIILGILKGKLNLDYQADVDNYKMKRALQIIRPTTELSGNWICHVSTFDGDAMEAARMVVFAPEKEIEMKVMENRRGNFVNISCWATRVFPKPRMAFYHEEQEVSDVTVRYDVYDEGAYDVRAYKVIKDTTLSSMIGSVFDCELAIPSTNYVKRRTTVFEPGSLELKDAMRMSFGDHQVSWTMTSFFIPISVALTWGFTFFL